MCTCIIQIIIRTLIKKLICGCISFLGEKKRMALLKKTGKPVVIFITGPPGCGKRTLAARFSNKYSGYVKHIDVEEYEIPFYKLYAIVGV